MAGGRAGAVFKRDQGRPRSLQDVKGTARDRGPGSRKGAEAGAGLLRPRSSEEASVAGGAVWGGGGESRGRDRRWGYGSVEDRGQVTQGLDHHKEASRYDGKLGL